MQVEQLVAAGQGSCGTPDTVPSVWRKHFSYTVPSISQEHTSYKTQSRKNGSVTPVQRNINFMVFFSQNGEANYGEKNCRCN